MTRTLRRTLTIAFAALIGVPIISAQTTTILTGNSSNGVNPNAVVGGVYTSPYYGYVGGSNTLSPIICDDFINDTYFSESWTAYVTGLSTGVPNGSNTPAPTPDTAGTPDYNSNGWSASTTGGPLEFAGGYGVGGTVGLTQDQAYTAAAYLGVQLLQQNQSTPSGLTNAEELSFAMWALFDPAVFIDQATTTKACSLPYGCMTANQLSGAEAFLTAAVNMVTSGNLDAKNFITTENSQGINVASVNILTYDASAGKPVCQGGACPPPPQEFIAITMPEPSSPALIGIDLLCVGGIIFFFKRRRITSGTQS